MSDESPNRRNVLTAFVTVSHQKLMKSSTTLKYRSDESPLQAKFFNSICHSRNFFTVFVQLYIKKLISGDFRPWQPPMPAPLVIAMYNSTECFLISSAKTNLLQFENLNYDYYYLMICLLSRK